jgi:hypothetical protein
MSAEMGELLVGAYLQLIEGCDFVGYNIRAPGGKLAGLDELDVVAFRFVDNTAYLCEVTTHIGGTLYGGGNESTLERIQTKFRKQKAYAPKYLENFDKHVFQFWAPRVPVGYLTERLAAIEGLEVVINGEYKRRVDLLRQKARKEMQPTGNDAFRMLQILEAMRD